MLDRFGFADVAAFHRTEHSIELVELHLAKLEITQEISGKRLQLLGGFDQPLSTVLGSTSNTRAVPRMPSPSARHAMTRTMHSTEARLP